jgi:uncharacterized protein YjbI with pentapeptide repeats
MYKDINLSALLEWNQIHEFSSPRPHKGDARLRLSKAIKSVDLENVKIAAPDGCKLGPLVFYRSEFRNCSLASESPIFLIACTMHNCFLGDSTSIICRSSQFFDCRLCSNFDRGSGYGFEVSEELVTLTDVSDCTAKFDECVLQSCFQCPVFDSWFRDCDFTSTQFNFGIADSSILRGKCIKKVIFKGEISNVCFRDVIFSSQTSFSDVLIKSAEITRVSLSTLHDGRGGLTDHNIFHLNIIDPVADAKRKFAGINRALHWVSLFSFISPYLAFVAFKWIELRLRPDSGGPFLLTQLFCYWLSGYKSHLEIRPNWLFVGVFCVYLLYNAARMILYHRVEAIRIDTETRGGPSPLSITDWWGAWTVPVVEYGSWIVLLLFIFNCITFLLTPVPI